MKRLLAIILAISLAGCSAAETPDKTAQNITDKNINLTTVCPYVSGEIISGPGGWYEEMHHTDGTTDILFTDISTGVRSVLSEETTLPTPYGCVTGIFFSDGYLYRYSDGYPVSMKKDGNVSSLHQFSADGKLLNQTEYPQEIKFTQYSSVVSDGKNLYFAGNNVTYNGADVTSLSPCIYSVNQQDLSVKEIFRPDAYSIKLIGGHKNNLIVNICRKDGNNTFIRTVELLDLTDFSSEKLFESRYDWHMLNETKLVNHMDQKGTLKIYDLESRKAEAVTLFGKEDHLNSWVIPAANIYDSRIFIRISQYEGNYEKSYVYDYADNKLTEVIHYYGLPYVSSRNGEKYCLIPQRFIRVFFNNGLTERADYKYVLSPYEDYIGSIENIIDITNEINYR